MSDRPTPADLRAAARRMASTHRSECVAEGQLLALHAGSLAPGEADRVRDHLAVCADCADASRDARRFVEAMGEQTAAAERGIRWLRLAPVAAGVALAVGGAWLAVSGRLNRIAPPTAAPKAATAAAPSPVLWSGVDVPKAAYRPAASADADLIWRGADTTEADAFTRAMDAYARDDFAAAARGLAAHLQRHPRDARAQFYRGVSLLLLGRSREALAPLQSAAGAGGTGALEARYYLALACLREGDFGSATLHLEAVERASTDRRDAARALLLRLHPERAR